ncbi:MAG: immune inhibitor A [Chloroflexota bacterium]
MSFRASWRGFCTLCILLLTGCAAVKAARSPVTHRAAGSPSLAQRVIQPIPASNLYSLANELRLHPPRSIDPIVGHSSPTYRVGHRAQFFVLGEDKGSYFKMHATVRAKTAHMYLYVQDGLLLNDAKVKAAASHFEHSIYGADRALFGSEWRPGVDGDPHIICLVGDLKSGSVGGYFSGTDEYPRLVYPYSNEHEMIYLNSANTAPGQADFNLTLAHEFQHMIHWHIHRHDNAWLNEGMSMLAERINGFVPRSHADSFLMTPNTQLNGWDGWDAMSTNDNHYGGSYLYLAYLYDRFGPKLIHTMLADSKYTDFELVNDALQKNGIHLTADAVFANWTVANYLNDPSIAHGVYAYRDLTHPISLTKSFKGPFKYSGTTLPYAAQYLELQGVGVQKPFRLKFAAPPTIPLLALNGHAPFWWSNRGDMSATRMERNVDLSHVSTAHLHYRVWYQIEKDYDYGFVEVSVDGGKTWKTLRGAATTNSNPYYANYGHGYTGDSKGWHDESISLSQYAGRDIKLRFQYITDDTTTGQGMVLKNIAIPEIGFRDTYTGWALHGFVPVSANALPSNWTVRIIAYTAGGRRVLRLPLSSAKRGSILIDPTRQHVKRLVVVVFTAAPKTTVSSTFTLSATPTG